MQPEVVDLLTYQLHDSEHPVLSTFRVTEQAARQWLERTWFNFLNDGFAVDWTSQDRFVVVRDGKLLADVSISKAGS